MGGARGAVACGLAKHYPNIKFIAQDIADVVAEGPENVPESMTNQIEFMAASCLEEQLVKGKEVYFMRAVLHNWPDDYCVKILKNLLPGECVFNRLSEEEKTGGRSFGKKQPHSR